MSKPYVVYGQKGAGSVPVEATLLLPGEPYELVERDPRLQAFWSERLH